MWRPTSLLIVLAAAASWTAAAQVPPPDPAPAPASAASPAPSAPSAPVADAPAALPAATQPQPVEAQPEQPVKPKRLKTTKPKPPATQSDDDAPEGPTASLKPPSLRCFVRDAMAFFDRTHVRCYNKARGDIMFFAVDTAQPIAATVLAKALKGMQMGKPVTVTYAPDSDLNPTGCDVKNCRRLLDIKN